MSEKAKIGLLTILPALCILDFVFTDITMEQQPTKRRAGEAVFFKKGEKIPQNALPLTDAQVLSIQTARINKFQPQKEV